MAEFYQIVATSGAGVCSTGTIRPSISHLRKASEWGTYFRGGWSNWEKRWHIAITRVTTKSAYSMASSCLSIGIEGQLRSLSCVGAGFSGIS